MSEKRKCPYCHSMKTRKQGKTSSGNQKWSCVECGKYHTEEAPEQLEQKKETNRTRVKECLDQGITDARDIFEYWADKGIVVDISYIKRYRREFHLKDRVENGLHYRGVERPYAKSGITGESIENKYLDGIKSAKGGFLKTAVYDIETTSLQADFGYLLTATFKNVDTGEIRVFRLDETESYRKALDKYKNGDATNWTNVDWWDLVDMELLEHVKNEFNRYDLVITWNGKWFDERFLATRLLRCGLKDLDAGVRHMDMLQLARRALQVKSKKLDAVKNFLKIDDEPDSHDWSFWRMAQAGIKEGFDFIAEHNIKDVEQLHQVSQRLRTHTKAWFF